MTLDTRVAVGAPVDVHELYAFCRTLLDTPADVEPATGNSWGDDRLLRIGNPGGIGLDAWLSISYTADGGPFPRHEHDKWCSVELDGEYETTQAEIDAHAESVATDPTDNGWAYAEVSFDTAYSFRGEGDESCSDLHARLVTALGKWLDAREIPWKWCNEYTGEWSHRYWNLDEFGNAHRSTGADAWFRGVVQPAIAAMSMPEPGIYN